MDRPNTNAASWAVLGGGMLGLSLALRLAQRGFPVTILEAAPHIGGLTASFECNDIRWDRFYHVIDASDHDLLALLDEIGLADEVVWSTTNTLFYDGEDRYPLNDAADYIRLPALGPIDKFRIGLNILYGSMLRSGLRLEDIPVEKWLVRWSGRAAFEKLWRPLLMGKLGENYRNVSAAYIWSVMRRFYGARHGRRKTETFGFVPGGYARIIDSLVKLLLSHGVELKTDSAVQTIQGIAGGLIEVNLEGQRLVFDDAVLTTASPIVTAICPDLGAAAAHRHERIRYQGVVCMSMLMKRPLGNAYMTYITDTSLPFTTVIEMSSLTTPRNFGGHHLTYLPKYLPCDDPMFDADSDEITSAFLDGLTRIYPDFRTSDIVELRIARARYVLALPTPGYSANLPPMNTESPGLYVCNSAHIVNASLSVTEAVALANRAVEMIVA
jgi:protoporphyrinogen oxidase